MVNKTRCTQPRTIVAAEVPAARVPARTVTMGIPARSGGRPLRTVIAAEVAAAQVPAPRPPTRGRSLRLKSVSSRREQALRVECQNYQLLQSLIFE